MKMTLNIIMIILSFDFLRNMQITVNPFKIKAPNWGEAMCLFGIVILIVVLFSMKFNQGYAKGEQDTLNEINKAIEQIENERRNNS